MCRALYETNSHKLLTREQNVCVGVMTSIHPCITGNVEKHYFSALSENTKFSGGSHNPAHVWLFSFL